MWRVGPACGRSGPPVGGACVPLRQIRRVRQCHHYDDEPPDGRVEREPLQGRDHEGRKHRDLLPRAAVLPGLQASSSQRPSAGADATHGSYPRRQLLPEGQPHSTRQAIPQGCPGNHWYTCSCQSSFHLLPRCCSDLHRVVVQLSKSKHLRQLSLSFLYKYCHRYTNIPIDWYRFFIIYSEVIREISLCFLIVVRGNLLQWL